MPMNKEKQAGFEAILERYHLTKEVDRISLQYVVELADFYMPAPNEGLMFMDAEELIRLIILIKGSAEVEVKGKAGKVAIKDKILLKYMLLSLHKLLQLRWGLNNPTEEELKAGKVNLFERGMNNNNMVEVGIKEVLEGEEGGFIQPYNEEELEALLDVARGQKEYKKQRAGRSGKNIAFLGDMVVKVLACIPDKVKAGMSKTDLLNFAGEVMALAGFLKDVPQWEEKSNELARCERMGYDVGEVRKSRKKMLENWLKQAKKVYCQADLRKECKECKKFNTCPTSEMLKYYDI